MPLSDSLNLGLHLAQTRGIIRRYAVVNGAAPVLVSLLIIVPLWLARTGVTLPLEPLSSAIATAFLCIFGLGVFLGKVAGTSWLWSGIKTLLIALATMLLILML